MTRVRLSEDEIVVEARVWPACLGSSRAGRQGILITSASPDGYAEIDEVAIPVRLAGPELEAAPGQAVHLVVARSRWRPG